MQIMNTSYEKMIKLRAQYKWNQKTRYERLTIKSQDLK